MLWNLGSGRDIFQIKYRINCIVQLQFYVLRKVVSVALDDKPTKLAELMRYWFLLLTSMTSYLPMKTWTTLLSWSLTLDDQNNRTANSSSKTTAALLVTGHSYTIATCNFTKRLTSTWKINNRKHFTKGTGHFRWEADLFREKKGLLQTSKFVLLQC